MVRTEQKKLLITDFDTSGAKMGLFLAKVPPAYLCLMEPLMRLDTYCMIVALSLSTSSTPPTTQPSSKAFRDARQKVSVEPLFAFRLSAQRESGEAGNGISSAHRFKNARLVKRASI